MEDFLQYYQPIKTLGKGKFASVALCQAKLNGKKFAAKHMVKNKSTVQNVAWEIKIFELLMSHPHPNIVACYDIFSSDDEVILVFEYMPNGDLLNFLDRQKTLLTEEEFSHIFLDIINAVNHLHSIGIVHRDLKLENICLTADKRAKIIDFNLSCRWSPKQLIANQFCGSMNYCAPELFLGRPYMGPEVDCWALGVLLYAMVFLRFPFETDDAVTAEEKNRSIALAVISGKYTFGSKTRPECSAELMDLIGRMLVKQQDRRTRLVDLLDHPWLETARATEKKRELEKQKEFEKKTLLKKKSKKSKQVDSEAPNKEMPKMLQHIWKIKQFVKLMKM